VRATLGSKINCQQGHIVSLLLPLANCNIRIETLNLCKSERIFTFGFGAFLFCWPYTWPDPLKKPSEEKTSHVHRFHQDEQRFGTYTLHGLQEDGGDFKRTCEIQTVSNQRSFTPSTEARPVNVKRHSATC
jgi:hypothetical protein